MRSWALRAVFSLYGEQDYRDGADRHAEPLSDGHFFLENQKREHRHNTKSAHPDDGINETGRQIGRGHQNRHQIENQIAHARAHRNPPGTLEHHAGVAFVASCEEDQIQNCAEPRGKQHQHIAVLSFVLHLLGALDDGATRVADKSQRNVEQPPGRNGFFFLPLGIHAQRDGADHQCKPQSHENGQIRAPEDQAPNGRQDQGQAVKQGRQCRRSVLEGMDRTKLASGVASRKQERIDKNPRIKGGCCCKQNAPTDENADHQHEIIEHAAVTTLAGLPLKQLAAHAGRRTGNDG